MKLIDINMLKLLLPLLILVGCSQTEQKRASASDSQDNPSTTMVQPWSADADTSDLTRIYGRLSYTGNEPFARPAVFTRYNQTYLIRADSAFEHHTFEKLQGKQVVLFGRRINSPLGQTLELVYYKTVK